MGDLYCDLSSLVLLAVLVFYPSFGRVNSRLGNQVLARFGSSWERVSVPTRVCLTEQFTRWLRSISIKLWHAKGLLTTSGLGNFGFPVYTVEAALAWVNCRIEIFNIIGYNRISPLIIEY